MARIPRRPPEAWAQEAEARKQNPVIDESGVSLSNPHRLKNPEEIVALLSFFNARMNTYKNQVDLLREALTPHVLGDGLAVYTAMGDKIYAARPGESTTTEWVDKLRAIDLGLVKMVTKKTVRCAAISRADLDALSDEEKQRLYEEQEIQWKPLREQALLSIGEAVVTDEPPDLP